MRSVAVPVVAPEITAQFPPLPLLSHLKAVADGSALVVISRVPDWNAELVFVVLVK
jgi:hypothetical protein